MMYRVLGILAVAVVIAAVVFLVVTHEGASDKNKDGDGNKDEDTSQTSGPVDRQERKGQDEESIDEKRRRWLKKYEEQFLSRKIEEFQIDIPEPSYKDANIKTGHVFLYGRYLPPPYRVEIVNDRLLLNGIELIPGLYPKGGGCGVGGRVTPETRRAHQASLKINEMMSETDFDDERELNELLKRVKRLDAVVDARSDGVGNRSLWVKFIDSPHWCEILWTGKEPTEEEKAKQRTDMLKREKRQLEKKLSGNGVVLWFSKTRIGGRLSPKDVPLLVKRINQILRGEKPKPGQLVADFAKEKEQLQELLPSFHSTHLLMEIIANWKRK